MKHSSGRLMCIVFVSQVDVCTVYQINLVSLTKYFVLCVFVVFDIGNLDPASAPQLV